MHEGGRPVIDRAPALFRAAIAHLPTCKLKTGKGRLAANPLGETY